MCALSSLTVVVVDDDDGTDMSSDFLQTDPSNNVL
jgi:hypothetical protein